MDQPSQLNLLILTFNCGRRPVDEDAFASQLFDGLSTTELPDILVFSIQEIAPIALSFLGSSFLLPYLAHFRNAVDNATHRTAGRKTYTMMACQNLGMTALLVFAKDSSRIQDMEFGGVGVGLWEMGNKGAIAARFTYQEGSSSTILTFIAAHLAPMEHNVERRNRDWEDIVRGLVLRDLGGSAVQSTESEERPLLSSIPQQDASIYHPQSHLFLAGDLNYRTSDRAPSSRDHDDAFPQPHEAQASPKHFSKLFSSDQLSQERLASRTCHGLIEPLITFPPTYKYDIKKGPFLTSDAKLSRWPWARHRWPSWCDRILYLPFPSWVDTRDSNADITVHKYRALPLFPTSDHRPVALHLSLPVIGISRPSEQEEDQEDPRINSPFEINKNWRSKRQAARRREIAVGFVLYLVTVWEGRIALVGTTAAVVAAWFLLKAFLGP